MYNPDLIKEFRQLIENGDYAALDARLNAISKDGHVNTNTLKYIAQAAIKKDDLYAFSILMTYGLSTEKNREESHNFLNQSASQGATKLAKFFMMQGYKPFNIKWSHSINYNPIAAALYWKNFDTAEALLQQSLKQENGADAIATAIVNTNRFQFMQQLDLKTQRSIANANTNPFALSMNADRFEDAAYFQELAPYSPYETVTSHHIWTENGHTALTFYNPKTYNNTKKALDYMVGRLDLDINDKSDRGYSFFAKREDDFIDLRDKKEKRILPLLKQYGFDLTKQLSRRRVLDLLPKAVSKVGYRGNNDLKTLEYLRLAEFIECDPALSLNNLSAQHQFFGNTFKQELSKPGFSDTLDKLLQNKYTLFNNPLFAATLLYNNLGFVDLGMQSKDIDTNSLGSFGKKLQSLENYKIKDVSYDEDKRAIGQINTMNIVKHIVDITRQMTENIIYPEAANIYGLNIGDQKVQEKLQQQMVKALFNQHQTDERQYIRQTPDKMLLLMNRYDLGVNYINGALAAHEPAAQWMAYCKPVQAPNGKWIIPITSSKGLQKAANKLKNCVYGSVKQARGGERIIFNVTSNKRQYQNIPAFTLHENGKINEYSRPLGFRNRSADAETQAAWDWFKQGVMEQKIPTNHEQFLSWSKVERRIQNANQAAGFDIKKDNWKEAHETVFAAWQQVLGGTDRYRWRHIEDVSEFIKVTGLQEFMENMSPLDKFRQSKQITANGANDNLSTGYQRRYTGGL